MQLIRAGHDFIQGKEQEVVDRLIFCLESASTLQQQNPPYHFSHLPMHNRLQLPETNLSRPPLTKIAEVPL